MNHVNCPSHSLAGVTSAGSVLARLDDLTLATGDPQNAIESGTRSVDQNTVALQAADSSLTRCLLRCTTCVYMAF